MSVKTLIDLLSTRHEFYFDLHDSNDKEHQHIRGDALTRTGTVLRSLATQAQVANPLLNVQFSIQVYAA
jgi:hypothetical protein